MTSSTISGNSAVSASVVTLERGFAFFLTLLRVLCFGVVVRGCASCFVVNACERGGSSVWVWLERQGVSGLWERRRHLWSRSRRLEVLNIWDRILFWWRLNVEV